MNKLILKTISPISFSVRLPTICQSLYVGKWLLAVYF